MRRTFETLKKKNLKNALETCRYSMRRTFETI